MGSFSPMMLFWYIFPVIVLIACNFLVTTFSLTRRFKIKSPDLATPFLLIGMNKIASDITGQSALSYIIIALLLLGIAVAVLHAYYYGEIIYKRYFKMFWRLAFLMSLLAYAALIVMNIIHYI